MVLNSVIFYNILYSYKSSNFLIIYFLSEILKMFINFFLYISVILNVKFQLCSHIFFYYLLLFQI